MTEAGPDECDRRSAPTGAGELLEEGPASGCAAAVTGLGEASCPDAHAAVAGGPLEVAREGMPSPVDPAPADAADGLQGSVTG